MTDNKWLRNSFVWVIIMVAMLVLFFTFVQRGAQPTEIPISQVVADAKAGAITEITVREESTNITVCYGPCKTGEQKTATREPGNTTMREYLKSAGVPDDKMPKITVEKASSWGQYIGILGFLLPTLILVAVFVFMMRQAQGTNNQA
ncbi:MAG TPA: ATP-dependent metallopeptidase FtsH/Yme1/Tma family protein, partial [Chloroflexia bacterium]|nr:ATP-dependent metallopeptidase FtsH/Yme1/Tma family protein [Chloroflexia bacterium]